MTPPRHVGRRCLPAAAVPCVIPWYARALGVRHHWTFATAPPLLDPVAVCDARLLEWYCRRWAVGAN